MCKRFVSIWFRYLQTDWFSLRQPQLRAVPFVLACPDHGRMVISAPNAVAQAQGIESGMVVADARAIIPSLQVLDDKPGLSLKLLQRIAEWCIRYTPVVAIDPPDGLILDVTGCPHLWGGEDLYLDDIITRLKGLGYTVRAAMAGTIGAAWAIARYGQDSSIVSNREQTKALLALHPAALRLEAENVERLEKLGLRQINDFIKMPRSVLRRRFGQLFIKRLNQATGNEDEPVHAIHPVESFQERLPCLDPIVTATGIEIALNKLLETICARLKQEQKGLRIAIFTCYRIDGKIEKIQIGTNRPSNNPRHLFKLFEDKIETIQPDLGIDLFLLEAQKRGRCISCTGKIMGENRRIRRYRFIRTVRPIGRQDWF